MGSIEVLMGLDLLARVSEQIQREVESVRPERVWQVGEGYFAAGCERSRSYISLLEMPLMKATVW